MTRLCTCPGSLASSLELSGKRNQPAEGSCKTCGGRFLVDGIGPIPGSMLGSVGLEVTNSINAELSWKTVTKGKRSRKPAARSLNAPLKLGSKSPKRVGDFSGSDSDKFGEAASGQCSSDRIEYVPIKKRRHLLRSPSPPPRAFSDGLESSSPQLLTPSSQSEDLEHLSDLNASSGQHSSGSYSDREEFAALVGSSADDGVLDDKVSGVTGGELYSSDDFSGIALLAAAACINNMDDDTDIVKGDVMEVSSALQGSNASTSSLSFRGSISCSVSKNLIRKDVPLQEHKKCSSVADHSLTAGCSSDENEECVAVRSVSSKVDRRHWDLNTLMEAWEEPHDDVAVGNKSTVEASVDSMQVDKLDIECCATQADSGNNKNDYEHYVPLEPMDNSKAQENKSDEFTCPDGSSASSQDVHPKSPSQVVSKSESLDNFPLAESCHGSGITISGEHVNATSGCLTVIQGEDGKNVKGCAELGTTEQKVALPEGPVLEKSVHENDVHMKDAEDCRRTFELPENQTNLKGEISTGTGNTVDVENTEQKVALPEGPVLEKSVHENDIHMKDAEDSRRTFELPENQTNLKGEISTGTGNTLDVENSVSTSEDHQHVLPKCEDLSSLYVSVGSQSAVSGDGNAQEEKVSAADTMKTEAAMHPGSAEIILEHDDHLVSKAVLEKISNLQDSIKASAYDDSHKSDVSQDDRGHLDGAENIDELLVDYDSPYEDGELRGSVLYCWDGDELEDGEQECVDYESDGRGGEDSDVGDYPGSEIVEAGSEGSQGTEKKNLSVKIPESDSRKSGTAKSSLRKELNDDKEKIDSGGKKGSNRGSGTADETLTEMVVERNDGNGQRKRSSDCVDIFDVKGSYMGEVGLKASKGKLQSRIEGPSSVDVSERNTQQGRSPNIVGSLSRLERDGSPDRFVPRYRSAVHEHDRNGGDSQWAYWDSRNRYQSSYRGLENRGQTKSRSGIADSVDKFGGLNFHDHKQPINYSSKGLQRQLVRRRSPIDRVDFYGVPRRMASINNHRSRVGSGNFSEGIGRGLRDEYNEPVIDDAVASSGRMPHYISRRDRSFSPPSSRVTRVSAPRRKSRSRSRTRSPRAWQSQRERNLGTRRHSRSPEFRSESRMDRLRIPFRKPSFAADYGEGFMSPPRGRFSPQRNYRWVDNRNFVDDLRHRRSPVGVFRRSQRLEPMGFSGRLKSDDHFRPVSRPGRIPLMDGVGRGYKLEENCDDRRNDERSGILQRGRHSEAGAILRRSRHGAEDNFDAGNLSNDNDVRSTDRRDVPRSAREDKRSFKL